MTTASRKRLDNTSVRKDEHKAYLADCSDRDFQGGCSPCLVQQALCNTTQMHHKLRVTR